MIIMLGVTPYRDIRYSGAHRQANVSKGAMERGGGHRRTALLDGLVEAQLSFWAMAYIITSAMTAPRINGKAMEA